MSRRTLRLIPFEEAALEPFCTIIRPPTDAGQRQLYTARLGEPHPGTTLRMHTNKVTARPLPYRITLLERHPRTAQAFIPLDVSRYVALVVPSLDDGSPELGAARGMIVPGDRGIILAAGAWHAGATVLDSTGSFCVLHHRDETPADDDFLTLEEPLDVEF